MARSSHTFIVAAPLAEIEAFVAEPTNARAWDGSVASIAADPLDPAAWDLVLGFYGKRIPFRLVRHGGTPGRAVELRGTHSSAVLTERFELAPAPAGTSVTYTSEVRLTGALRLFNKGLDGAFAAIKAKSAAQLAAVLAARAPAR